MFEKQMLRAIILASALLMRFIYCFADPGLIA